MDDKHHKNGLDYKVRIDHIHCGIDDRSYSFYKSYRDYRNDIADYEGVKEEEDDE